MQTKRYHKTSIVALIFSTLPLVTFIPTIFHITLTDTVRSVWAGGNMLSVMLGLILSIICVHIKERRSVINVISTIISFLWILLIAAIIFLALFLNFIQ